MKPAGSEPRTDDLPSRRRYAAIVAVSLGTMLSSIDNGAVNIALPTLARNLHVEPSVAVSVITVFQLVLIMTILPFSALGDRIGHRTLYQFGQIVFAAATLSCLFAQSLASLVVIRVFQALGIAASSSVSSALIRSIYPQSRLGRGIAFNTVVAATSASIAPTVGGLVLSVTSWRWLFAGTVPLGLLSMLIGRRVLPQPRPRHQPYDVVAAVMCAAMFGTAVLGLNSEVRNGVSLMSAALITLAVVLGIAFVRREAGQAKPILPVDLLRQRQIALASGASLAASVGSTTVMLTLPFRLQSNLGYSAAETGLVLGAWPMVMMVAAPAAGMMSDRISAGWLGSVGMSIAIVGMSCLAFLPPSAGHWHLIWRIALAALGYGLFYSPNARQVVGSVAVERAAAAGALSQTTRMTGLVLGSTVAAALLAGDEGTGSVPPLLAAALAAFTGVCSLGVIRAAPART